MSLYVGKTAFKSVTKPAEIPSTPHWVILTFDKVSGEDSYGESFTVTNANYHVFMDERTWLDVVAQITRENVERNYGEKQEFSAFHVDKFARATFKIDVSTEVE